MQFGRDAVGNLTGKADMLTFGLTCYRYDSWNRLISAQNPPMSFTPCSPPPSGTDTWFDAASRITTGPAGTYTYATPGKPNAVSSIATPGGTDTYTHDAVGNRTSWNNADGDDFTYTWDAQGRMLTATFRYRIRCTKLSPRGGDDTTAARRLISGRYTQTGGSERMRCLAAGVENVPEPHRQPAARSLMSIREGRAELLRLHRWPDVDYVLLDGNSVRVLTREAAFGPRATEPFIWWASLDHVPNTDEMEPSWYRWADSESANLSFGPSAPDPGPESQAAAEREIEWTHVDILSSDDDTCWSKIGGEPNWLQDPPDVPGSFFFAAQVESALLSDSFGSEVLYLFLNTANPMEGIAFVQFD
jgi:YD repeat-containing protein